MWQELVSKQFVENFVRGLPGFSTNDNIPTDDQITRKAFFRLVCGELTDVQASRIFVLESALDQLSRNPVQDPRSVARHVQVQGGSASTGAGGGSAATIAGASRCILQPAYMESDTLCGFVISEAIILTGVELCLRPGRRFFVNDSLAFNLVIRKMQAKHPLYDVSDINFANCTSKGTRPTSGSPATHWLRSTYSCDDIHR